MTKKMPSTDDAWRVLCVDDVSLKIISSCATMSDLADVGVCGGSTANARRRARRRAGGRGRDD